MALFWPGEKLSRHWKREDAQRRKAARIHARLERRPATVRDIADFACMGLAYAYSAAAWLFVAFVVFMLVRSMELS